MQSILLDLPLPYDLKNFSAHIIRLESQLLKKTRFQDSLRRDHYVLEPKDSCGQNLPLVLHLSGYFGAGHHNFGHKTLQENFPQVLDKNYGDLFKARHVFIDTNTFLGGSQFINSDGFGPYQDYILKEILPAIEQNFNCIKPWILCGASSGGYGALHLLSLEKSPFEVALSVAPDSFFESSLLPDFFKLANGLKNYSSVKKIIEAISSGEFLKNRNYFDLANALAMTLCYSSNEGIEPEIIFPIDLDTGILKTEIWSEWKSKDPVVFLPKREKELKNKKVFLSVGTFDNHCLQMGSRQIKAQLKKMNVDHEYVEFKGDHSNLGPRKLEALKWLKTEGLK